MQGQMGGQHAGGARPLGGVNQQPGAAYPMGGGGGLDGSENVQSFESTLGSIEGLNAFSMAGAGFTFPLDQQQQQGHRQAGGQNQHAGIPNAQDQVTPETRNPNPRPKLATRNPNLHPKLATRNPKPHPKLATRNPAGPAAEPAGIPNAQDQVRPEPRERKSNLQYPSSAQ
ncbi:hypothetical protein T484DRAFT_2096524 [Baffinella frigidus]|nr:hypothetical protein T484DRAFT_2096524 [Cryptophyta sp. CCMP2293]